MNPALLQQSYPIEYPPNTEQKYFRQDRSLPSSTSHAGNDFLPNRKPQSGIGSGPIGQTLALPPNLGLDYSSHHLIQESPYQSGSQLLLSPPSSVDGSTSAGINPTSSAFHSTPSRFLSSNVSSAEQYSAANVPYLHSTWNDPNMMDLNRTRPTPLPPTLSPPITFGLSNGNAGQYFNLHRSSDPYNNAYVGVRQPGTHMSLPFFEKSRNDPSNTSHMPVSYHPGNQYSSMLPQVTGRPEGPPFEDTKIVVPLVSARHQSLIPEINASIQKGFFQVEGKWTCYRRNYFTVSCAFHFKNAPQEGSVYLQRNSQHESVQRYAVSISARTATGNQDSESRTLVQHTPKRDKATESVPGRQVVQPAPPQASHSHGQLIGGSIYAGSHHTMPGMLGVLNTYASNGHHNIPTSYTFERIQFQRATANNGKRRAQQQYFHVVVELSVDIGHPNGDENWILVATRQSFPMVVRGRSPGHYKDNVRRDGHSHMDQDRNGAGSDSAPGSYSIPPLMGLHSSMDWATTQRCSGQTYGHSYASGNGSDCSSSSTTSSNVLDGSQNEDIYRPTSADLPKTKDVSNGQRNFMVPIPCHEIQAATSRKRSYEEENMEYDDRYYQATSAKGNNFSPPSFEFASANGARRLCLSS